MGQSQDAQIVQLWLAGSEVLSEARKDLEMGTLDRSQQREILESLAEEYPLEAIVPPEQQTPDFVSNLHYLMEHGLVEARFGRDQKLPRPDPTKPRIVPPRLLASDIRITARGMDFLADDGGLSALLTIVNVRKAET